MANGTGGVMAGAGVPVNPENIRFRISWTTVDLSLLKKFSVLF